MQSRTTAQPLSLWGGGTPENNNPSYPQRRVHKAKQLIVCISGREVTPQHNSTSSFLEGGGGLNNTPQHICTSYKYFAINALKRNLIFVKKVTKTTWQRNIVFVSRAAGYVILLAETEELHGRKKPNQELQKICNMAKKKSSIKPGVGERKAADADIKPSG
jgi:hypothetical protein